MADEVTWIGHDRECGCTCDGCYAVALRHCSSYECLNFNSSKEFRVQERTT